MADQVEEVKLKSDIVSVISEHVDLKKAGRNYKGLCPFHSEKTPSFMVSPELQIYKCFGCGESGDIYSFLQNHEGMDFAEALKFLADKAGIKLKQTSFKTRGEKEVLYEVNALTSRFYQYVLLKHKAGKKAFDYLTKDRGLKEETIKTFQLGFSPDSSNALGGFLVSKKKLDTKNIEKAGIGYKKGRDLVDRLRGRVIFPLHDHRGNVVGFAGRVLPDDKRDTAKYINSPETPVYSKGKLLYGLHITKKDIKKKKRAVVVEGELDLISSWQAGVKEVVATKGTALTEEQVRLVSRFTDSLVLALDTDIAGNEAARRGIGIAQNEGLDVKVARLKSFKDPDEAARKDPDSYKKTLDTAVDVWEFVIDSLSEKYDPKSASGKAKIGREVSPLLATIEDKIVQAHYIKYLARKLEVPEDSVRQEVAEVKVDIVRPELAIPKNPEKSRREKLEERLLALLFHFEPKRLSSKELKKLIATPFSEKVLEEYNKFTKNNKFDLAKFASSLPAELKEGFAELVMTDTERIGQDPRAFEKELALVGRELQTLLIKNKLKESQEKIKKFEETGKKKELNNAEKEFSKLSSELAALEEDEMEGIILFEQTTGS